MGAVLFGRRNRETPSSNDIVQFGACHLQRLLDMLVAQVDLCGQSPGDKTTPVGSTDVHLEKCTTSPTATARA